MGPRRRYAIDDQFLRAMRRGRHRVHRRQQDVVLLEEAGEGGPEFFALRLGGEEIGEGGIGRADDTGSDRVEVVLATPPRAP